MNASGGQFVEHDRGLGTAYERWCFYQLVNKWAAEYGVESMLEGPIDGMAGVRGVHGVGLARAGVRVVAAVANETSATVARAVYARAASGAAGGSVEVRVADARGVGELPASDMVVAYHSVPFVDDWRAYLGALARLARKVLVVTVCNPDNWGVAAARVIGGARPPDSWRSEVLAPRLWELGRVRDHVYFDAPWWPDLPVAPGQSLANRLRQMLVHRKSARLPPPGQGTVLARKYVYGADRWPYFGGPGWIDELEPALLRHPAFEGVGQGFAKYVAHLHAFVVDMRPRTARAKRRLAQFDAGSAQS
jgi:hypothetical protein